MHSFLMSTNSQQEIMALDNKVPGIPTIPYEVPYLTTYVGVCSSQRQSVAVRRGLATCIQRTTHGRQIH